MRRSDASPEALETARARVLFAATGGMEIPPQQAWRTASRRANGTEGVQIGGRALLVAADPARKADLARRAALVRNARDIVAIIDTAGRKALGAQISDTERDYAARTSAQAPGRRWRGGGALANGFAADVERALAEFEADLPVGLRSGVAPNPDVLPQEREAVRAALAVALAEAGDD